MVSQYGTEAAKEAASRSNRALELKDEDNYEIWQRVALAILDLQRPKMLDSENVH